MAKLLHRLFHRPEPEAIAAARDARTAIDTEVRARRREAAETRRTERERQRQLDAMIQAINERTNPLADDFFGGPPPLWREPR